MSDILRKALISAREYIAADENALESMLEEIDNALAIHDPTLPRPKMTEVNLPFENDDAAADFPSGKNAEILWKVREALSAAAKDEGYTETGKGIGCGGENSNGMADIGLIVDGVQVEVRIHLPKQTQ